MNIGYIGNIPEPVGGAEVFLREFLRHFLRDRSTKAVLARWRKQIFTYFPEVVEKEYAPRGTVKRFKDLTIYYIFETLRKYKYERCNKFQTRLMDHFTNHSKEVSRHFYRHKVSLVHTHMLFPNLFFGSLVADSLHVPHILSIHGMLEFWILDSNKKRYPKFASLIESMLSNTDTIIAVSSEIEAECKKRGAKNIVKIYPGIDTDFFTSKKGGCPGSDILFLGSIRKDKGGDLLIKAFCKISSLIEGNLVLIGNNLLNGKKLKTVIKNQRIKFMGVQDKINIQKAIKKSKLVVLPSKSEGMPLSILEAMTCGRPVLVTAVGDLRYLIKDGVNGFILKDRTVNGLAQRLKTLVRDPVLERVGERAIESALPFSIKNNVEKHRKLYSLLIKRWQQMPAQKRK